MKRALGITSLTLALAASAAAADYLTQVPRLAYPLQRLDGWALSDGGSYGLEVVDAEGCVVLLGIQATALDGPVERYPAFIGRPLFGLPLTVTAGLGSTLERQIDALAHEIARSGLDEARWHQAEATFSRREQPYAVAWSLHEQLAARCGGG
ncbi:hypothetical protein WP8S17C03_48490 [Metapseudomonas otitidis]|uniref:Uncharacterized protein n=1 Tax=Metapseudomonas otitidis TaxID=319939 RepID=A0A6S5RVL9_9GAMM|nr:hypothetical protein [Pseudomonas otitidis]BBT18800.1 hypothetical protein WP8S17C03_48490 [Pseudomonas otitidis]